MDFRHPTTAECTDVHVLVQAIVDEIYGGLWSEPPLPIDNEDWSQSWIAIYGTTLIGVVLTCGEWVEDLWVSAGFRGRGVGYQLLTLAETEIKDRGFHTAKLRVLSYNRNAIGFYKKRGWQVKGEYCHERFPVFVTEMQKHLCL